jgi:hypothetical protein
MWGSVHTGRGSLAQDSAGEVAVIWPLLAEQLQHERGILIRLRKECGVCLLQNILSDHQCDIGSDVGIDNLAMCG